MGERIHKVIMLPVREVKELLASAREPIALRPTHESHSHESLNGLRPRDFVLDRSNFNHIDEDVFFNHTVLKEGANGLRDVTPLCPPVEGFTVSGKVEHCLHSGLRTKPTPDNIGQHVNHIAMISDGNEAGGVGSLTLANGVV